MSQSPLKDQLKSLEHLQELDLNIDSLRKKKAALPGAMKSAEDSYQKARATLDARKNAVAEIEKLKRQTQAAIELNNDRVTPRTANSKECRTRTSTRPRARNWISFARRTSRCRSR